MRIGVDMWAVQAHGESAALLRELISQLLAQPSEHHWTLFFHEGLGGIGGAWPGAPDLRQLRSRGDARDVSDRVLEEGADCDLLLLTGYPRTSGISLPPPRLSRGPRLAVLLDGPLADNNAEPRLRGPARATSLSWIVDRLRQYDLILTTTDAIHSNAVSALDMASEAVVNIEDKPLQAAERLLQALAQLPDRPARGEGRRPRRARRERIAFFSPLPPARSGISDYSARLLDVLQHHYAIDLFHDPGYLPQLGANGRGFPCFDYRLFRKFQRVVDYAGIVYQMGNSGFHGFVYETLLEFPGLVVLHDFCLPDLCYWYAAQSGGGIEFMAREIALESPDLAEEFRSQAVQWATGPGGMIEALHGRGLTLNRRVLAHAKGLVSHDAWGARRISDLQIPGVATPCVIPHGASVFHTPEAAKTDLRRKHELADDELIVSCFGIVHTIKYPLEVVEAFQVLLQTHPHARLLFVGRDASGGIVQAKVEELGLANRVRFMGHVTMDVFLELAAVTDIGINLRRPPTRGETSGALLTLLGCGVPTIVTDVDAFSSYPSTVVEKIGPLSPGDHVLAGALNKLAEHPQYRRELGAAAQRHVAEVHPWPRIARLYAAAIHSLRTGQWRVPDDLGEASDDIIKPLRAA